MTLKSYFNSKVKKLWLKGGEGGGGGRTLSVVFISSFDKLCNKNPIFNLCGFVFKFDLLVKRQRNIKVLVYILCIQKHPQSTQQQHGNHQSSMTAIIYNGDNSLFNCLSITSRVSFCYTFLFWALNSPIQEVCYTTIVPSIAK